MGVRRSLALLALILLVGCESFSWDSLNPFSHKDDPAKAAKEYRDQLDISSQLELVKSGTDTIPTLHLKITNTGDKTVEYMKLVITLDEVSPVNEQLKYHDVRVVKPLTEANGAAILLPRDGGATSALVEFSKIPSTQAFSVLNPKINLTEVRFR